ncbi:MFS transporter [Actinokineospora auranticolor]|uniref:EmrB/QacA subfamily drug resistance transporter n=1 Tax=Actinokineospora auranticolor TaxID=155976 RepID=A0A2S6GLE3_9PSEU|nr:MFS transporter [Actinokineospora auranticolor]PPK66054.1 EmrB/QacA subfamily drug resistance transporter [Actinokineospora auranticolor]
MTYDELTPRRRLLVTIALLACAFLAMLDGTVIGTALPRIVDQLHGGDTWYTWLVTAYVLTSSISVPIYGRFSDLRGRRGLLLVGLVLFLAGSAACGFAGSMTALIVARAVQGLGAGSLLTLGMALVRDLNPPGREDGVVRMQTAVAVMMILGLIGGPLVGGVLTDHADWRWAFWVNLPVGMAAAAVIASALPPSKPEPRSGRLDVAGIALLSAGLSLVLIGLSLKGTGDARWRDAEVLLPLAAGALLLAALVPVERRASTPVLPPHLMRRRTYAALLSGGFFFQIAVLPIGVFLPLYFQHIRGFSATASGLSVLPLLVGMVTSNRLTALLILRTRHTRPVLLAGAAVTTLGALGFFTLGPSTSVVITGAWLLLTGVGVGPAMGGITIATQNAVDRADMGAATAGSVLAKQIGGAVGLACAQTAVGTVSGESIGAAVGWIGGAAGLLALASIGLMRDVVVGAAPPVPEKRSVPA